jgi:hypothetical protein
VLLSWTGATSGIDVVRDGVTIATGVNGASFEDRTVSRGAGDSFVYKVCSGSTCSNVVTAGF